MKSLLKCQIFGLVLLFRYIPKCNFEKIGCGEECFLFGMGIYIRYKKSNDII